jgi:hypothetical protein
MQVVNKIGAGSAAKVYGLTLGLMGIFVGIIYALMFTALGGLGDEIPFPGSGGLGIAMLIVVPVFYGLAGFIIGALGAAVYNFVAKKFGGLEIELSEPNHRPVD